MTEEEQDQLASAYLDGEATPQEVALVERDPDLRSRVEGLRSVSAHLRGSIAISPELKAQHLAVALAQFDSIQTFAPNNDRKSGDANIESAASNSRLDPSENANNVIDFASRSGEGTPSVEGQPLTSVRSRSMPRWLSAAAVSLCVLGGGIWLASQMGSSSDEPTALAADSSEAQPTFATDDTTQEGDLSLNDSTVAMEESADAMSDGAASQPAPDNTAPAPEADDVSATDESTGASEQEQPETASDDTDQLSDTGETPENGGFFPNDPVASFAETPDAADLVEAPPAPPRVDLEQSRCVNEIDQPVQVTGYLPIEISGNPAEFFIFTDEDGNESGVVLDSDCQPLTAVRR